MNVAVSLLREQISTVRPRQTDDRGATAVLIVSPNNSLREVLRGKIDPSRWRVAEATSGAVALNLLRSEGSEGLLMLLDPALPDLTADEFGEIVRNRFPHTQLLLLNPHTAQLRVENSSTSPVSIRLVEEVNQGGTVTSGSRSLNLPNALPTQMEFRGGLRSMIGESPAMQRTFSVARLVASRSTTVLITGESGTGKDLIAQEIHLLSPRKNQPYVVVNCSAIPETLLEAELFGYTRGAFTGAAQARIGRIHAAQGGTLFLDEIGDMPLSLQGKILRFLEQGEVQRIGGNENLKVDVRVVAATNADLKGMVAKQRFREDLYYRLAVFPIQIPPLRERMSDLEALTASFCKKFSPGVSLSQRALEVLFEHNWPGNVRELRNTIERAAILAAGEPEIMPHHIVY